MVHLQDADAQQSRAQSQQQQPGGVSASVAGPVRGGQQQGPVDDDDDIFGDTQGAYKPTRRNAPAKAGSK